MDGHFLVWLALALVVAVCVWLVRALVRSKVANEVADPRKQLGFVEKVAFEARPLLNRGEFQVLVVLEEALQGVGSSHRVMAQTCFGEFLKLKKGEKTADAERAYRSINSKRADFVIIDAAGYPVVVVEYQGSGHYQGTAHLRDAVKKEACRSAGVALLEVMPDFVKTELAVAVRGILARGGKRRATL
ncbi:DUF2726 domain-containing protein [Hyphomicrobium sp. DY-1]|uniref:DUF2726 domain-containing protein n=1 Tax=Hyphomicrobium sp. DY-1 TaxID=3075650 RepID=UPI0039C45B3F